jgi:outer membrane receptor protein involved in Fe transport
MSLGIAMAAALAVAQPQDGAPAQPADTAAPPTQAAPPPATQGVTSYPPEFFVAAQPNTALDMVLRLPGFSLDTGDNVRGFGGAAGNVLIDGARPASKDDSLEEVLKRINASQVARIDVIRGSAPGIDMQGKSVIANVIRKTDGGLRVTAAYAGNYVYDGRYKPSVRLEGSKRFGKVAVEAGFLGGFGVDDGAGDGPLIRRAPDGTLVAQAFEDTKGQGLNARLTGAVDAPVMGGQLHVNGLIFYNPYRYRVDDYYFEPDTHLEKDRFRDLVFNGEGGLRYTHPAGANGSVEVFLVQRLAKEDVTDIFTSPDFDADFALHQKTGESIARGTWKHRVDEGLSFELGAEGAFNWLNGHTSFLANGEAIELPAANVRVEEKRGEGFGVVTWRMIPQITVEGGLRYEMSQISATGDTELTNSFHFAKPRLSLTWSPDANNQVRGRIEREVGQLKFSDFVANSGQISTGGVRSGNPDLSPQQDWVFEAAYEHRFWNSAQVSVTARHHKLTNVIDRAPIFEDFCRETLPPGATDVFDAPCNIGDGTRDDLALALTLPTDKLGIARGQLQAQSTWHWSKVTDPTTGETREISGLHPVDWEVHFTQALPKLKSTWGFDIFGAWRQTYYRFNEIDTDELKTWVAFFTEYKPRPDLAIRVELDNATARHFQHRRDVYPAPRNASTPTYIETRDNRFGRMLYIRVRKTFG